MDETEQSTTSINGQGSPTKIFLNQGRNYFCEGLPRPTNALRFVPIIGDFAEDIADVVIDAVGGFPGPWYSHKECLVWTAVHEFGHALGFLHEHRRPDFQGCLKEAIAHYAPFVDNPFNNDDEGFGIALTEYDSSSVMNYCSGGAGTNKGQLSAKDIVGLQVVYGRRPPGSLVATNGRCIALLLGEIGNGHPVTLWDCWGGLNQSWSWSTIEGTLRSEQAPDLCLDDASGGTALDTPLDVWECVFRANARWNFNFAIVSLGHKCLNLRTNESVLGPCEIDTLSATYSLASTRRL